jgi:hypothetical protein
VSAVQTDYFVIESAPNNSHPLLQWDENGGRFCKGKHVVVTEPVRLRLGKPVPRDPVMVDHHSLPQPVFSTRVKEVLEPLGLHGVQLVPADVKVKPDDVRRYWLLHVFNEIHCLDRQRSSCTFYSDGDVLSINRLVLDERALQEIPLEQRLLFVLAESTSTYVFHHTLVDRILALTPPPEGLRFFRVDRWNDSAGFQPPTAD